MKDADYEDIESHVILPPKRIVTEPPPVSVEEIQRRTAEQLERAMAPEKGTP
jgi:hypothetical protein